jgi:hypothetical protein
MKKLNSVYILFWVLFVAYFLMSNVGNPPPGNTGAPPTFQTCSSCHGGGAPSGSVSIIGFPATITPNTTYPLTVIVTRSNATPQLGGFQSTVLNSTNNFSGSFNNQGPFSQLDPFGGITYFEHFPAQSFGGNNSVSYTVNWVSPMTGSGNITMYAAANLANGTGGTGGDFITTTSATGTFMGGGGAITVTTTSTNVSCFGGNDGSATANPSGGGGPPYTYSWSNGGNTQTINNLTVGNYFVTVTNMSGGSGTAMVSITQPPLLTASITNSNNITCFNPVGSATAQGGGGTPGYTYNWSNGATGQNANFPLPGNYTVTVTDTKNCTATAAVTITANITPPISEAGPPKAITCLNPTATLDGTGSSVGPNFLYSWNGPMIISGGNTLMPVVGAAGTYTLTVTNTSNGCTSTDVTSVAANTTPPTASAGPDMSITCTNPTVTLDGNASSSGANFTYSWSGPGIVSGGNTKTPLVNAGGTYTLTVTNTTNGCTATDQAVVTMNTTPPVASAGPDMMLTCTSSSVILNGNGSSSGANFTYSWSGPGIVSGGNTKMPVVNIQGTYTLTVTNTGNGCTSTDQAIVTQDIAMPTSTAGPNMTLTCTTTSLQLNGNGSSSGANFTYQWTTANGNIVSGANTLTPTVDQAGTYCLTVTNTSNGCSATDCTNVSQNTTAPIANAGSGMQLTCTVTTVTLDGSASSSGANFTYSWSGPGIVSGGNTAMPQVNVAGTYVIIVTNTSNSCTASASVNVAANTTTPVAEAGPGMVLNCNNTVVVLNGSGSSQGGNFSYQWSGPGIVSGANTLNPTVDKAGAYSILVTNSSNGCTATDNTTVTLTPALNASIPNATNVNCNGNSTGSATAQGSGGNGTYDYAWSNGASTATISNVAAGTYTVTITDDDGCTATAGITITEPAALIANASATGETTPGANDGTATANPTGGTPPYTFAWSNGATAQTITGLMPGNYTVTVSDDNGCTKSETVTVATALCTGFSVSISSTNPTCNGAANGTATANPSGGSPPYTFAWSTGASTQTIANLAQGTYTVTVSDDNGCEITGNVTLTEPAALSISIQKTNVDCNGAATGSATATASGGTPAYLYSWSNGGTGASQADLAAGTYTVTTTDNNGCTATSQVIITQPPLFTGTVSASDETAVGANDGTATAAMSGGTAPYSFLWSNGDTTSTITGLVPDVYCVTATDSKGCIFTGCDTVFQFGCGAVALNIAKQDVSCFGGNDGMATVEPVGFSDPVIIAWSNGSTGATIGNLVAGTYTVSITDANNCTASEAIQIIQPAELEVDLLDFTDVECEGQASGTVTVSGSGGTPGYTYIWQDGNTSPVRDNLAAGTYTVSVSDDNDCVATLSIELVVLPDTIRPIPVTQDIIVYLGANGTTTITASMLDGGTTDNCGVDTLILNTYFFDCSKLGKNTVMFMAVDFSGNCDFDSATVTVLDTLAPVINCPGNLTTVGCNTVVVYVTPTATDNCDVPVPFLLEGMPSGNIFPVGTTPVTWVAEDLQSNASSCTFTVTVESGVSVTVDEVTAESNNGMNGEIFITASGMAGPFTYLWTLNGSFFSDKEDLTGLAAGEYVLVVTDANGCTFTQTIEVDNVTGIDNANLERSITLQPNPSRGEFSLLVDLPQTADLGIHLLDLTGRLVQPEIKETAARKAFAFDLSEHAAGMYVLRVIVDEKVVVKKVVVSR